MSQPLCPLLVVDDEPAMLASLLALLEKDFEVVTASSLLVARDHVSRREFGVVLADQIMPGGSGVEFLEWVRERSPHTVRLLMTAVADFEVTVKAINRGEVFRIILKPWRSDELQLIMQNAAKAYMLAQSHERLLEDLRRLNTELEERVGERTRELEAAVYNLKQKNYMLEKLSLSDPLTGLPNRRAIDNLTDAELHRRARHQSALTLAIIDVDNFKEINTRYLLPGGDQVLVGVAKILGGSVRMEDTVGRIGGDEFQLLAPETDKKGAHILAERLRSAVESTPIPCQGEKLRLTVSVGCAVAQSEGAPNLAGMKHCAAAALAEAKNNGRNRCVIQMV